MEKRFTDFKKQKEATSKKGDNMPTTSNIPTVKRGLNSSSSEVMDNINANILNKPTATPTNNGKREPLNNTPKEQLGITDNTLYPPKEEAKNENVNVYGKLAKFPKNTKAKQAFNFINNVKDPKLAKKDIWYLMVEKQDNELQLIRYQQKQGVNLSIFVNDLKNFYREQYKSLPKVLEAINKISVGGDKDGNISMIKNIPNLVIDTNKGKKLIQKITEDLIILLS